MSADVVHTRATVVGAGIAGLTAAYRLHQAGMQVRVLEASARCGGPIHSVRTEERLFELGPNTVPSSAPQLGRLIDDLGLRGDVQLSRPVAGRRLIWRHGQLHSLPEKPPQLLTCSALGPLAKLRLLAEPLIPARREGDAETLLAFGRRRLGSGAVAAFLDPFITGVFAGQLDRLGVDAVPQLADWEQQHGSLFRALIARRRAQTTRDRGSAKSGPAPLISFPNGLETLPNALHHALGSAVSTGCRATAIEDHGKGFRIHYVHGTDRDSMCESDALVVATPAHTAARLLQPYLATSDTEALETIEHPFVATVGLAYRRQDVAHPLDAFGVLVASDSRLPTDADVLGILFPSSIFSGRAKDSEITLTIMVGGTRDPTAASLDDRALSTRAQLAARRMLGAHGKPTAVQIARWPAAIPQYGPGHRAHVAKLRRTLAERGGLAVAGNYLDGVGVEGAIASGDTAAVSMLEGSDATIDTQPTGGFNDDKESI